MLHHSGDVAGSSSKVGASGAAGRRRIFTTTHRKKLDLDPGVLCWTLYTGLNEEFSKFLEQHASDLRKMEGVDLVWHQFKSPSRSIQVKQVLTKADIDIGFEDMPALVFFDSFSDTSETYLFKINDATSKTIAADLYFIFDQIRRHYRPPTLKPSVDAEAVEENLAALSNARRNFLYAVAPNSRIRKVRSFASANGYNLVSMISNVAKPFL